MTTNEPNQPPESNQLAPSNSELDFSRLTHQNWLFINAFLNTGSIIKAYQLAKYEGTEKSAPYQIFKRLKGHIEAIGDLDITSRARLQADIKSVLDIPLDPSIKTFNLKEWLEVRKLSAKITPDAKQQKPQISVLVINRPSKEIVDTAKGDKPITSSIDPTEIIDAEQIP